jgi:uncharacterized protein YbjQ (UPF0145 family)
MMTQAKDILVVTTENVAGREIDQVLGEVFGLTTRSKNVVADFGASLKTIVGGEIKAYTNLLEETRQTSLERLRENAAEMGADAVVMMRFDSGSMGADMNMVAAYGTAVTFK